MIHKINISSHRQADLILIKDKVIMKMDLSLVRLHEQILEPKYVIVREAYTIIREMFSTNSYHTIQHLRKLIHVVGSKIFYGI